MRNLTRLAKLTLVSALAVAYFPAPASAAQQVRSFYQNSSASCHGVGPADESRLERTEQSLKNTSAVDAVVVCSLSTDALAVASADDGTVDYVAIWAKRSASPLARFRGHRIVGLANSDSLTCTMLTSYSDDPATQSITKTVTNLPVSTPGGGQAFITWVPEAPQTKFRSPVNLRCIVAPNVELNDWLVLYTVDVGN